MARRAKIVCTLGPSTATPDRIGALVAAGMDVARLNFSHGTHDQHAAMCAMVRAAAGDAGRSVGVLADLQGPKIRLGAFPSGPVTLVAGDAFTVTTEPVAGTAGRASTSYGGLPGDVTAGQQILVDDGRVALQVTGVEGPEVRTRVVVGGPVSDHKGLNLPGAALSIPALTTKDADDLRFALGLGVDLVALSFVRSPADAESVRTVMAEVGVRVPVLAKLEKPQAVDCLDDLIAAFDGIMVARGDLGVELPLEDVPLVQKRAVSAAREYARPSIVATQVLESMISAPRPTRAEASDCANAVLDGADAIMLSGETSVGAYAVEAVATMARIIRTAEQELERVPALVRRPATTGSALALAAVAVGDALGARVLVACTETGDTARRLARHRSRIPLVAFTPEPAVHGLLSLVWGVETFLVDRVDTTDAMVRQADEELVRLTRCGVGDLVVVVAGTPPGVAGTTNTLRVHRIGDG